MDVLRGYEEVPEVKKFIDQETALLNRYTPPMLCVGEIAMPHVLEMTMPVRLPWFGQSLKVLVKKGNIPRKSVKAIIHKE